MSGSVSLGAVVHRCSSTAIGLAPEPEKVLAYLAKHPGSSGEDAARSLGTDTAGLRPVMKELIEEKKVKAKGKARGMRYSAV